MDRLSQAIKQHEAEVNTRTQQPPHCSPVASSVWWHRDLATQERAKKEALRKKNIAHRRELERQILASASRLDDPFFNMSDTERLVSHARPRKGPHLTRGSRGITMTPLFQLNRDKLQKALTSTGRRSHRQSYRMASARSGAASVLSTRPW